jgi:hypothetical protein
MRLFGHVRRPGRDRMRGLHDGRWYGSWVPYGWADLVGYRVVPQEATQALPVLAPLLTPGQRWRADRAGGRGPAR